MNKIVKKRDFSILINSCDAYSDVWPIFFYALRKNWPLAYSNDIYLNSESEAYSNEIKNLNFSARYLKDEWGSRLINSIKSISNEYIIILLEDYILDAPVDQNKIDEIIDLMEGDNSIAVCYLKKLEIGNKKYNNNFVKLNDYTSFRLNTAPAVWRKSHILEFIENVDNPWAWEVFGSYRTFGCEYNFLQPKDIDIYNYASEQGGAIYRGKWVKSVVDPVRKEAELDIDFSLRGFADEQNYEKRNLSWAVNFLLLGFRMVGWRAFFFFLFYAKEKMKKWM